MFSHKGEKCSEPTRFLIHESIYEKVLDALVEKANAVTCGSPFDSNVQQGPQCNEMQFNKIMSYIEIGKQEAELVAGGYADREGDKNGFYIRPTIFSRVDQSCRIAKEEIFGPILCCTSFASTEEAVQMANDTAFGLAAGIYTRETAIKKLNSSQCF